MVSHDDVRRSAVTVDLRRASEEEVADLLADAWEGRAPRRLSG